MRFLVVDDDELSRELLTMLLEMEGYEVEAEASGEQALVRLSAAGGPSSDVILADMQMPGLSGEALALALRTVTIDTPMLFAMSGSQPAEPALRAFDGFLLKPFSMGDLDALLLRTQKETKISVSRGNSGAEPHPAGTDMPPLNEEVYAKMGRMMPGAQLGEMYEMCLADARERLGQMTRLAEEGDDEGFRRAAHTVKGGCGMIGATELYELAELGERDGLAAGGFAGLGHAVGTSAVTALLARFSGACDRLERILGERR